MEHATLETLLREVQARGIRITAYTVDEELVRNRAWNRRRHAIIARVQIIEEYQRRYARIVHEVA